MAVYYGLRNTLERDTNFHKMCEKSIVNPLELSAVLIINSIVWLVAGMEAALLQHSILTHLGVGVGVDVTPNGVRISAGKRMCPGMKLAASQRVSFSLVLGTI